MSAAEIEKYAQANLDNTATKEQLATLEANKPAWEAALWNLLDDAEAALAKARKNVRGPERANVLNDLDEECFRCLLYTSPSPRDQRGSRMPSSA